MFDLIIEFLEGPIPMEFYLVVSTVMFFCGVYGFLSRKNMLMVLISVELMLNAADINFVIFNRYLHPGTEQLEGFFFTLFAIGIAAAETAVAIAIIINIFRNVKSIYVDENITTMKH